MHLMVLGASRLWQAVLIRLTVKVSMHLMVLGASRRSPRAACRVSRTVSMHLMVLGASRRRGVIMGEGVLKGLNAPDGAGCFPTLGVLSVVPPGETGPGSPPARKRPLDRVAHRSLNQTLPSSRKGRHRRASRGSAPPEVDVAMRIPGVVPCSSDTGARTWAINRKSWFPGRRAGGRRPEPIARARCASPRATTARRLPHSTTRSHWLHRDQRFF